MGHFLKREHLYKGRFLYFLPLLDDDGKYQIDKTKSVIKKVKAFKGLPHGMRHILPMVVAQGNMKKDTTECVKVTVTFHRKLGGIPKDEL